MATDRVPVEFHPSRHVEKPMSVRRNFCLLLMLAAFLCPLLSEAQTRTPKEKQNQWEADIKKFEASDKANPPPKHAILFTGSSSIRIWTNVAECFPEYKVINRGFGGSQIADSVRYAERIVLPYKPMAIVFYAGDNDLAEGKTPDEVFADFKRFVYKVHWAQRDVKIFFISIKPSPARWRFRDKVIESNRLIREFCAHEKNLKFIDVYPAMLGPDASPRKELFQKDGLHLNADGYKLWTSIIKPYLADL